jgi:hypothetical protein
MLPSIVQFIVAAVQGIAPAIQAIQASSTLTDDQKKQLIAKLKGELDATVAAVEAVVFKTP